MAIWSPEGESGPSLISTLWKIGEARDSSDPTSAPSEDQIGAGLGPERVHRTQIPPETFSNEKVSGGSYPKKFDFRSANLRSWGCQEIFSEKVKFSLIFTFSPKVLEMAFLGDFDLF